MEMHHLVRDSSGIEHFVEKHRLALVPTAVYLEGFEAAGLKAHAIPFMPSRDRIIGTKPR
jgi:hypothetical protein